MKNWDNWIFLLLNIILSIPVGIFINIVSPAVESYLKNRSLSSKERKKKLLLIRYINIKNRREHRVFAIMTPVLFGLPVFFWLPFVSIGLFFLVFQLFPNFSWFRVIVGFIISIPMYYSSVLMFQSLADSIDAFYFDSFKRRTIKKLKRLGCNPKDYGIE